MPSSLSLRRSLIAGASIALALALNPATAEPSGSPPSIDWSIARGGSQASGSRVQLTIESRWDLRGESVWSNDRPIGDLPGLSAEQLLGPPQPVRFALIRDAGRLDCSGTAGQLTGSGGCSFSPDLVFGSYLQARGIGIPTRQQAFSLTMSGVGRDLVDALARSGFERPNVERLTAMGIHGASAAYVRDLASLGYRLSADDVIAFKIHGVEPEYIRTLAAVGPGLRQIRASDLVSFKIHGVRPEFIREMAAIQPEFRNLSADDLVAMAIHGVQPELARSFARLEGGRLSSDDLVSMAIHGVTADFIEQLATLGYRNLTAEELVSMAIHGVTPDYVRSLQHAGMVRLSADQLLRLRIAGFAADPR